MIINLKCAFFISLAWSPCLCAISDVTVSGVKLRKESHLCKELPFGLPSASFCSFVRIDNITNNGCLFLISDDRHDITLGLRGGQLYINAGKGEDYLKRVEPNRFFKLCLISNQKSREVQVVFNYYKKYRFALNFDVDVTVEDSQHVIQNESDYSSFCVGSSRSDNAAATATIAGLLISDHISEFLKLHLSDRCVETLSDSSNLEDFEIWQHKFNAISINISALHLCKEAQKLVFIKGRGSYSYIETLCKSLKGRFLTQLEREAYLPIISNTSDVVCFKDSAKIHTSWVVRDRGKPSYCPFFNFTDQSEHSYCIVTYSCTACLISTYLEVSLFGKLEGYSRIFSLNLKTPHFELLGENKDAIISGTDDRSWILVSKLHDEKWMLNQSDLPMGRQNWSSPENTHNQLLALTSCDLGQFTCDDGECLSMDYRCSSTEECNDGSDEEHCDPGEQKKGNRTLRHPTAGGSSEDLNIRFVIHINGINDIIAAQGIATMDVVVVFFWRDPGLTFWNIKNMTKLDCNKIWTPSLKLSDECRSEFKIQFSEYRSSCRLIQFVTPPILTPTVTDSFTGRYIDGKDIDIGYAFSAIVEVPCRFDFQKYPFGRHNCSLCFWDDDTLLTGGIKFIRHPYIPSLEYRGREHLGEFAYVNISHREYSKVKVQMTVELESLYGYHLLNSFIPSVLMLVISYTTFYFDEKDFNERVMVSLTALLTLVLLFTQTGETAVKTTYVKLLDVWYMAMISFSFTIVAFNAILQKIGESELIKQGVSLAAVKKDDNISIAEFNQIDNNSVILRSNMDLRVSNIADLEIKRTERVNNILKIAVPLAFILFGTFFIMKASDAL